MLKSDPSPDMFKPFTVGGILFIIAVLLANTQKLQQLSFVAQEINEPVPNESAASESVWAGLIDLKATVKVDAAQGWQTTNILVQDGDSIVIKVLDGQWTEWKGQRPYTPGIGSDYICARIMQAEHCVEPAPESASGALIGKIGSQLLHIGGELRFTAAQTGMLSLRINDGDPGLFDNDGKLIVEIVIE